MRLSDLLTRERIDTELHAPNKAEALSALAALLSHGLESQSAATILPVLEAREAQQSTGVGDEVAIPHGRIVGLAHLAAAIAIVPEGVEFDSVDRRPVRIFVAILAPEGSAGDHLRVLARVARLPRDARVRQRLLAAPSPEQALQVIADEESTLPV